jgi:type I restriction enzyme S subunit
MSKFKLKQLLSIKNGRDHKELNSGNIPIYGSGGIMRYGNKAIYNYESILLPRKGTLANIQYVNKPFWTVDTIYYSIVNKKLANPFYLFNFLKLLDLSKLNTGTSVPSMTFDSYYNLDIDLPELSIQQKIASVLSALDAKIELNNRINSELEKMAKTLYDYWFVQFDFPDENGKPYKSSGGAMVWNAELKRAIPAGWEVKNLFSSQYTKLVPTGVDYFEGEKIYLSTSEVENSQIINHSIKTNYLNRKSRANMQPKSKTIWFARMKDTKKIILIDDYCDDLIENYIFSTGFAGIELKNNSLYFLWNYINSKDFEDIKNRYSTGTTQKSITNEGIEKIKILIPSQDLLNIFDFKVSNVYKKIYVNNQQNQTLANLRNWLLPMLMNGQIKVQQCHNAI